jgi:hypothetical protein
MSKSHYPAYACAEGHLQEPQNSGICFECGADVRKCVVKANIYTAGYFPSLYNLCDLEFVRWRNRDNVV